jgi:hypothetical protein
MEVSGNDAAPGTPADIYACAATNGVRAPNLDFKLPGLHTGDGTTAVQVCPCASGATEQVRKRVFLHHFILKMDILPRQARNKHREN